MAFWALMVFMGILLLAPQFIFPALAPLRIAFLAVGVAVMAYVLDRWATGRPLTLITREMKIAACLLAWATVTIPFSLWPGGSVDTLTGLFLKSLVLFWLIANTITTVWRFRQLAWGLTLMSVPIAATALTNYRAGIFLQGAERIVGYDAPLTSNPNDLALTLNLIIPFVLALLVASRGRLPQAVLLVIVVLDVTAVLLTFSRGGFLTLTVILGSTLTGLLRSPKRAWGVALLAVVLLGLPLLPTSLWQRWATITDIESDTTGSSQARRDLALGALQFVAANPVVGAGIGANVLALREQGGQSWSEVHNVYLQYAVELGLPGLGLFLALFATCLASTSAGRRRVGRSHDARDAAHLARATRLSLTAFGVAALFHPVAYNFFFYYLAGLAVAASRISGGRIGPSGKRAPLHA